MTPSPERRMKAGALAQMRSVYVTVDDQERARAEELSRFGFRYMDALHLACAERAQCELLLTTDQRLLARSRTHQKHIMVTVANPLQWLAEVNEP